MLFEFRGRRIYVEEMEEMSGELDELHHYNDTLLRSSDGNYYLRRTRLLKMPPNAEAVFNQRFFGKAYFSADRRGLETIARFPAAT